MGSGRETDIFNYIVRIGSSGASIGNNKWNVEKINRGAEMPVREGKTL